MNGIEILLTAICINSTCDNAVPIQGNFMNITTLNTLELNLKEERFKGVFFFKFTSNYLINLKCVRSLFNNVMLSYVKIIEYYV